VEIDEMYVLSLGNGPTLILEAKTRNSGVALKIQAEHFSKKHGFSVEH
jgi:hypothetical protein